MPIEQPPIVFFDGVCNLCNGAVQWIIRHDPNAVFKLAALQSEKAKAIAGRLGWTTDEPQSIVLMVQDKIYQRSDAVLEICWILGGWWRVFYFFKIFPAFIRDAVYNFVARNRYRWFGKQEVCWMPTPELNARFL